MAVGISAAGVCGDEVLLPLALELLRVGAELRLVLCVGLLEDRLELLAIVAQRVLGLLDGDVAAADQRLGVDLADRALLVDQVVHQRLRQARVIGLVVAATAVADQVDHDVLVERLPELVGQPRDVHHGLGVVAVHVEDRRLDHPRRIGRVHAAAAVLRRRGEPDLVVDDHVDGAAGPVAAQLAQVQRLGDHALPGEGGVAVHQERQDGERLPRQQVLLGAHDALEDGIDGLEVRGVRRQVDPALRASLGAVHALGAQVVLDVAGTLHGLLAVVALELAEDLPVGLPCDVRQDVQPAAVRHADADLVHPVLRRVAQDRVEQRDDRLAPLEGEPLLADVLGLQERLEGLGGVEAAQDPQLLLARGLHVADLDAVLHPAPLLGVLDVHVLHADAAAVGVAQDAEDVAQLHERLPTEPAGRELPVEVPQGQAVRGHVEVGVGPLRVLQRVGVGHQVAADPVGVDELLDPRGLVEVVLVGRGDVLRPADRLVGDAQRRRRSRRRSRPRRAGADGPSAGTPPTAPPG